MAIVLSCMLTLAVLRDFAGRDPVVTSGTAAFELGRLAAGHVRGR